MEAGPQVLAQELPGNKLAWVLVIVLTAALGAIVYLVVGRPGRRTTAPPVGAPPVPPPPPPG